MAPPDPGAASPPAAPSATRAVGARVLVVLAAIVAALALVAGYARHAAVNSNQFANRATVALRDDSVRTLIAERVTDEVVLKNEADLLAARPIIESAVSGVVGGRAFSSLFRSAVRDVHRAVFERDERTVTLTIADVGTVLAAALQRFRPSLAREVRDAGPVEVVQRRGASLGATLPRYADAVRLLSIMLPLAALALAAGALWVSPERRRTVAELGAAAAGAGSSWWSRWAWRARRRCTRCTARRPARPRARCGTRSSATCAPRPGSSRRAARSSRPRRPRSCAR